MRGALFAILALWAAHGAAQTTFKCIDEQKRVTYTNTPCDKQGLAGAGPVSDRTTTMQFVAPRPTPKTEPAKAPAEKPAK